MQQPRDPIGKYHHAITAGGETVDDHDAHHMMATECARVVGEGAQETAGLVEVINVIGRGGLLPKDYRLMTAEDIEKALPSFLFYKVKDLLPEEKERKLSEATGTVEPRVEDDPSEQPWSVVTSKRQQRERQAKTKMTQRSGKQLQASKLRKQQRDEASARLYKVKGRWVGGGNHQTRVTAIGDQIAPTARPASHSILLAIAALEKRLIKVGDVPSAYLQTDYESESGEDLHIVADRATTTLIVKAYPDLAPLVRPNGTMILQVLKALYGLIESALLWYKELVKTLEEIGYEVLEADMGMLIKRVYDRGKLIATNILSVHVDDIASAPTNNAAGKRLSDELWSHLEAKWPGIALQKGPNYRHLSWDIHQDPKTGVITRSQGAAIAKMLTQFNVHHKEKRPSRGNLLTRDAKSPLLASGARDEYVSRVATINFYREGRADIDFVVGHLQRHQVKTTEQDQDDLNHLLGYLNRFPDKPRVYAPKDSQIRAYCDASFALDDLNSYFGYIYSMGGTTIAHKGGRIKTAVRSVYEAEGTAINECISDVLWARDVMVELGYPQEAIPIAEDNQSLIKVFQNGRRNLQTKSKHVRLKWKFFRQQQENGMAYLTYCPTEQMHADIITKPTGGSVLSRHSDAILHGKLEDDWDIR